VVLKKTDSASTQLTLCFRRPDTEVGRRKKRRELTVEQKQEIREAFELFDTDKDRQIDYHELKVYYAKCCLKVVNSSFVFVMWHLHRCDKAVGLASSFFTSYGSASGTANDSVSALHLIVFVLRALGFKGEAHSQR